MKITMTKMLDQHGRCCRLMVEVGQGMTQVWHEGYDDWMMKWTIEALIMISVPIFVNLQVSMTDMIVGPIKKKTKKDKDHESGRDENEDKQDTDALSGNDNHDHCDCNHRLFDDSEKMKKTRHVHFGTVQVKKFRHG